MLIKLTDEDFQRLVTFIKSNYGVNLINKKLLIEGRLSNTLISRGILDFNTYIDILFSDTSGEEITQLLNKLTTNHTYFMREEDHFKFFRSVILPYIEQTVKDKDARIWSAGCSSGQEAYTLAMIIDEYFGERKSQWDLKILATDISNNVLKKAREGIYEANSLSDIPDEWVSKYFKKIGSKEYQICDKIRSEVVFKEFNLMDEIEYKKQFDLILCRNVMIYFDAPTKNALIERFYDVTKSGGYFFIGHAETAFKGTRYKYIKPAIYRKA